MKHGLACLSIAAIVAGCGTDPQLVVDLVTDFAPRAEFARVHTELLGERGALVEEASLDADGTADYLSGVRIAELSSVRPGTYTVRVSLLGSSGSALIQRSVLVRVSSSQAITVPITRSCRDVTCPASGGDPRLSECSGGRCVDPSCHPEDPSSCLPPACTTDDECVPAVSCAVGQCVSGDCFFGDEGACGPGRWCNPDLGCLDLPGTPDAGTSHDAGASDAGPIDASSCTPRSCAELGFDCGDVVDCGVSMNCGSCTAPDTCGGGGAANRCGNGDVTPPSVMIVTGPDDPTRDASPAFTFAGDDGPGTGIDHYECRIDAEAFAPCTSAFMRTSLSQGTHTFEVRATDRAGNVGAPARWTWTIDRTRPTLTIDPISDPMPASYTATATVTFSFSCSDALTGCGAPTCRVDGMVVGCSSMGGSVDVGYTGPFAFGDHTLSVSIDDGAGNTASAMATFTVSRCATDMQFPSRTSSGFTRGSCCAGLVESTWWDFSFSYWHPRGDGSCRPMSDFDSFSYETIWGGGSCIGGMTTYQWLQARGLSGCTSLAGRAACMSSEAEAQSYCGTDGGSGSQTPFHGRASEGWHPAASAGCSSGTLSNSLLMQRYGADNVCFGTVDLAGARGSVTATDSCKSGLTRYCRTNPVDSAVACVCATADPYAADGRN